MAFPYTDDSASSVIGSVAVGLAADGTAVAAVGAGVLAAWSFVIGDNEDAVKMTASALFLTGT